MIISARNLPSYFHTLRFPVQILEEKGDRVARIEDRAGLLALIEADVVIGIGSWKRLRHIRLNRPVEELAALRIKFRANPIAADSKTGFSLRLDSGQRTHSFHVARSDAYRGSRPRLDGTAL